MTAPTVVALGPVDHDIAAGVLGPGIRLVTAPTPEDMARAEAAIVRAAFTVDEEFLATAPRLRVLARTGVGVERIDLEACARRGIAVAITPGAGTDAVAEGVIAHALHLLKRLPQLHETVRSGRFADGAGLPCGDIAGSTVGVYGFGRIGRRLTEILEVMGARVIAYDPYATTPDPCLVEDAETLLRSSDLISLHAPLTPETHHLIDRSALAAMRPGAVLINLGRGPLVDLDAAHEALQTGRLGGLGLDVFETEPPPPHPVFDHPRVLLTPHRMGMTARASRLTIEQAARACRDVIDGGTPRHLAPSTTAPTPAPTTGGPLP